MACSGEGIVFSSTSIVILILLIIAIVNELESLRNFCLLAYFLAAPLILDLSFTIYACCSKERRTYLNLRGISGIYNENKHIVHNNTYDLTFMGI